MKNNIQRMFIRCYFIPDSVHEDSVILGIVCVVVVVVVSMQTK